MVDYSAQTDTGQVLPHVYDRESKALRTNSGDDVVNIDEASASITYVGYAAPGTADLAAQWRIKRIEITGTVTKIRWANGDSTYSNVWTTRASATYT